MSDRPMTVDQRRAIFALCRELGWPEEFRHDMLERWDRVKASRGENEDGETLRALIGEEDRRVAAREEGRG